MKVPRWVRRALNRRSSADAAIEWAKSSFSYANGNCVEVAGLSTQMIHIRDSKNPEGPVLLFTPAEWDAFLGGVRNGEFDRRLGRAA